MGTKIRKFHFFRFYLGCIMTPDHTVFDIIIKFKPGRSGASFNGFSERNKRTSKCIVI